jgi:hypothetical protein
MRVDVCIENIEGLDIGDCVNDSEERFISSVQDDEVKVRLED